MGIDGQCHCGAVTYQAEIDPERVSICHRTDCQALTGSAYRVTVICAAEQVQLTGRMPKVYGKRGDNGRICFRIKRRGPLFTAGEDGALDDWATAGQHPPARPIDPAAPGLVRRSAAPWTSRSHGIAGAADGLKTID